MNAVAMHGMKSNDPLRPLRSAKPGLNSKSPMPGALITSCGRDAPQPAAVTRRAGNIPWAVLPLGQSPGSALLLKHAAAIALAAIPLLVFGVNAVSRPSPLPVKPVQTESIRVVRMDATTFRGRWMPIHDMPPATVVHQQKGDDALTQETGKPLATPARPPPAAVRNVKRASLHLTNICTRHGMRKVETVRGNWKGWRCRK